MTSSMSINTALKRHAAPGLVTFLGEALPEIQDTWWEHLVVGQLTPGQAGHVRARDVTDLGGLDLQALLQVFQRNFTTLRHRHGFDNNVLTTSRMVRDLRNLDAHAATDCDGPDAAEVYRAFDAICLLLEQLGTDEAVVAPVRAARQAALTRLAVNAGVAPSTPASKTPPVASPHAKAAPSPEPTPPPVTRPPATDPVPELVPQPSPPAGVPEPEAISYRDPEHDSLTPESRVVGLFRVFGPEDTSTQEIRSFSGVPVIATQVPFRVTGPGSLEFTINVYLIDEVDAQKKSEAEGETILEAGQVMCVSRHGSPEAWDAVVNQNRLGLYVADDGNYYANLRPLQPKPDAPHMAGWKMKVLPELKRMLGVDPKKELERLGALAVGPREDVTGATGSSRGWPCVKFEPHDLLTPLGAYVLTALQAFHQSRR